MSPKESTRAKFSGLELAWREMPRQAACCHVASSWGHLDAVHSQAFYSSVSVPSMSVCVCVCVCVYRERERKRERENKCVYIYICRD